MTKRRPHLRHFDRSGEISPSNGTGGITAGDLSTQRFMGARVFTIHTDMQLRSR